MTHVWIAAVVLTLAALHVRSVYRNYHYRGLPLKTSWWGPLGVLMAPRTPSPDGPGVTETMPPDAGPEAEGDANFVDLRRGGYHWVDQSGNAVGFSAGQGDDQGRG